MLAGGALAVLLFVTAGANGARRNDGAAFAMGALGVVFLVFGYGREKELSGAQPLTSLKPGREYIVDAVLGPAASLREGKRTALVVSWHVDYGHYEQRLARLDAAAMKWHPMVGQRIVVQWDEQGQLSLQVS